MPDGGTDTDANPPPSLSAFKDQLPLEWTQLVMSFTKAVLKECRMPDNGVPALHVRKNLYGFAAEYFQGMQEQQNTRMRRGLQLSQCVRLHADLCKDRQVMSPWLGGKEIWCIVRRRSAGFCGTIVLDSMQTKRWALPPSSPHCYI